METVKAVTDVAKTTRLIERPIHGLESNSLIRAVRGFSRTHSRIAAWRLVRLHMAVRSIARGQRPKRAADRLQAGSEPRQASKSVLRAMSAEHQIKTGVPGLPVDLWSVAPKLHVAPHLLGPANTSLSREGLPRSSSGASSFGARSWAFCRTLPRARSPCQDAASRATVRAGFGAGVALLRDQVAHGSSLCRLP